MKKLDTIYMYLFLVILLMIPTICTTVFAADETLAVSGVYSNSIARTATTLPYDAID